MNICYHDVLNNENALINAYCWPRSAGAIKGADLGCIFAANHAIRVHDYIDPKSRFPAGRNDDWEGLVCTRYAAPRRAAPPRRFQN